MNFRAEMSCNIILGLHSYSINKNTKIKFRTDFDRVLLLLFFSKLKLICRNKFIIKYYKVILIECKKGIKL